MLPVLKRGLALSANTTQLSGIGLKPLLRTMLTERQEEILDFVRSYQSVQSVPPSTREIARHFSLSQATVMGHLRALAKKSQLERLADGKWGLKSIQVQSHLFSASVYGSIPAGLPAMQEQAPESIVIVDPAIFGLHKIKPDDFWFLRVTGHSMIEANIFDGDLVALVRRDAKPGDIIAALVDETTTTLKRMVQEKGRMILRAANPSFADIVPERLESQGVVVGVIRRNIA